MAQNSSLHPSFSSLTLSLSLSFIPHSSSSLPLVVFFFFQAGVSFILLAVHSAVRSFFDIDASRQSSPVQLLSSSDRVRSFLSVCVHTDRHHTYY